jgi:hypothetical protein
MRKLSQIYIRLNFFTAAAKNMLKQSSQQSKKLVSGGVNSNLDKRKRQKGKSYEPAIKL